MYIVKKKIAGHDYYYLNKSVREKGKVISKNVAYLGKDKKEAERKAREIIERRAGEGIERKKEKKTEKGNLGGKKKEVKKLTIDEIANFCKKKGFVFRSSDLYGGFSGFWDFGPLGVELFNNIKKEWWSYFVQTKENMVGIESSIISHPLIWKASGHLESFKDVMGKCKKCSKLMKLEEGKCSCGGDLEKVEDFNLMFETKVGTDEADTVYLRPETAQGMFTDFKLAQQVSRQQLPFGIAQIGKCFRNEIAPRDFLFRSREFHIGEFEFFIHPEEKKCNLLDKKHLNLKINLVDSETQEKGNQDVKEVGIEKMLKQRKLGEWHAYWLAEQVLWFNSLGLREIKIREHTKDELSHYSSATFDIDYEYVFGSRELAGIADRSQYDLKQHQEESKQSLEIFDEKSSKKVIPRVIEPTFGIERVFLAVLTKAYVYDESRGNIVLKIPLKLSPIKAAVFPIVKKPKYVKIAESIVNDLKKEFNVVYDRSGSIGRRYARNDEIGTPYCITIDDKSPKQKDCTIRNRDDTKQIRVKISELKEILRKLIEEEMEFEKAGKLVETRMK
jgi:glycyl-tRNA synthetase